MNLTTCLSLSAGVATTLGAVSTAAAESASYLDTSAVSEDRVRAIVAEMLADTENRTSLLQTGTAGHDGDTFFVGSGDFRLNVSGSTQIRYTAVFRDDGDVDLDGDGTAETPVDSYEGGFSIQRTRIAFHGNVQEFDYRVEGDFDDNGNFSLLEAYAGTGLADFEGLGFQVGQYQLPFLREEVVREEYQLAVDRSFVNSVFGLNRGQGLQFNWENDNYRVLFGVNDGAQSLNTDISQNKTGGFNDANGDGIVDPGEEPAYILGTAGEADLGVTARLDWKFAGLWNQFQDFTSMSGDEFAALFGVAAHYEFGDAFIGNNPAGGQVNRDYTYITWTADLSLEGDGWNAMAAFVHAYTDMDGGANNNDFGVVVQGGFFIPETDWELFGRWDGLFPDSDREADDNFNVITAGANYYLYGHAAKFTIDVQIFLDEGVYGGDSLVSPRPEIGYLATNDDGEVSVRGQFQLLF